MTQDPVQIASVVEGHGEVQGLPVLIRRISQEIHGEPFVVAHTPHRIPKSKMRKSPELTRVVRLQSGRVRDTGGVVVLTDADDDDAEDLRMELQATSDSAAFSLTVVVIAVKEYEAWFLAGIESLREHKSIRDDADYCGDPEQPRNAKLALEERMTESYDSIRHQPAFNARLDIAAAATRSPSLTRFVNALGTIIHQTRAQASKDGDDRSGIQGWR